MVCTVYAYEIGKMKLVGHQLSKIQEGKLHYCSVEIDLCESEDNKISYDLSLFDDTADPKIVIEIIFGVRLFLGDINLRLERGGIAYTSLMQKLLMLIFTPETVS